MSTHISKFADHEKEFSDSQLVALALNDNGSAFALLVDRYFPMVVALGIARLGSREAAEELAQEVFLRVFMKLDKLRDARFFAPWLTRITRNLAEDWARSQRSSSSIVPTICLEELPQEVEDRRAADPCEHAIDNQHCDLLYDAVFRLPQHLREIVLLHYIDDLEKVEIARRLGVHASTIGRRLEQALDLLRCSLQDTTTIALACKPSRQAFERTKTIGVALAALSLTSRANTAKALAAQAALASKAAPGPSAVSSGKFFTILADISRKVNALLSRGAEMQISAKGATVALAAPATVIIFYLYTHSVAQGGDESSTATNHYSAPVACGLSIIETEAVQADMQASQRPLTTRQQP